jgi:hypothetical protein
MNKRWQRGLSPFDGDCIVSDDFLSVEDLRSLLAVVVPDLESRYAAQTLYAFDDWHQHDGYVTERRATDWGALAAVSGSDHALVASRQGDTYVHRSFYPEDCTFLLRYAVADEDSRDRTGFAGTFDLSASSTEVARLAGLLPESLRQRVKIEPSRGYFDRTYAG